MIFLYILLGILAVLLLFLFSGIRVVFEYNEEIKVKIGIWFFSFNIFKYIEKHGNKPKKQKVKKEKEKPVKAEKKETKKRSVSDFIKFVTHIAKEAAARFLNVIKIDLKYLYLSVASDEAEKTALLYGSLSAGAAVLLDVLKSFLKFRYNPEKIKIEPDFTKSEIEFKTKIVLKTTPIKGIIAVIYIFRLMMKEKGGTRNERTTVKAGN